MPRTAGLHPHPEGPHKVTGAGPNMTAVAFGRTGTQRTGGSALSVRSHDSGEELHRDRLNQSFSGLTATFTDPRLCAAIVGRLTYHGTIIETGTHSCRLAHARSTQT